MPSRKAKQPSVQVETPSPWTSVAIAGTALGLYLSLLCPAPVGKDTSEFVLVLATLGVAHPGGYALYTLAGHLFVSVLHAAGASWAWAANAFSALGGAVALGLLHALAARLLAPRLGGRAAGALAVLPVAAFALDPTWTAETTVAEVNSWHVAWVAGACLATLVTARVIATPNASHTRVGRVSMLWGLVMGAGLAHHLTSVLFAGPLTLALGLAAHRARRRFTQLAPALIGGVIPPSLALGYFAWRATHPAIVQWPAFEPTFAGIAAHASGSAYHAFLGRFTPSPSQQFLLARYVYPWLVPSLAAAGLPLLQRRSRADPVRATIALAVLVQTAACFSYGVPDPTTYFLPPLAVGLVILTVSLSENATVRRWARAGVTAATVGMLVYCVHGWLVSRQHTQVLERFDTLVTDMWRSIPAGTAFVVWDNDMAYRLRVFQQLEGLRTDLEVVQPRQLTYPPERRRFIARFGFDPLAGLESLGAAASRTTDESGAQPLADAIVDRINQSAIPVYLFLPREQAVRVLPKASERGE